MSPKFGKYYLEADFATRKNAGKNKVQDNKDGGAGNTMPEITAIILTPVYPRWRGEHDIFLKYILVIFGLSPLARGTPANAVNIQTHYRFIPAGAGNTVVSKISPSIKTVYPRWRGEHTKYI